MTSTETVHTADVVAHTPNGYVLLIERGDAPYEGHWALPGGCLDPGESSNDVAVRELEEETGVRVAPSDLVKIGTWNALGRDPRGQYSTDAYRVVVSAGTAIAAGDDARTARWWPVNALPPLAFDHADILAKALEPASRDTHH